MRICYIFIMKGTEFLIILINTRFKPLLHSGFVEYIHYMDTNNFAIATDPDKDIGFAAQWTLPSWALNYRRVTFTAFKKSLLKPKTNHFGISFLLPEGGAPTEYHGSQLQVRL